MEIRVRQRLMCHAVTALPEKHPWLNHFTLYVIKRDIDDDRWYISTWFSASPTRYLCKDGFWRYGISDYEEKFGTLDQQSWTDEDHKEAQELHEKFNEDRYYSETDALAMADIYASKMFVRTHGIEAALALKFNSDDDS